MCNGCLKSPWPGDGSFRENASSPSSVPEEESESDPSFNYTACLVKNSQSSNRCAAPEGGAAGTAPEGTEDGFPVDPITGEPYGEYGLFCSERGPHDEWYDPSPEAIQEFWKGKQRAAFKCFLPSGVHEEHKPTLQASGSANVSDSVGVVTNTLSSSSETASTESEGESNRPYLEPEGPLVCPEGQMLVDSNTLQPIQYV